MAAAFKRSWLAPAALFLLAAALAARSRTELARIYAGVDRPHPDPAPVLPPAQALASIQTVPGYQISLAAAEPMVEAPVAGQFDEDGRLWVVEMRTFMRDLAGSGEATPGSRVVVLEDSDGDGAFDKRTVFMEGLVLPRAVAPCYGGALVLEPPNLYFCRDTNGDGKADEKRLVLSGIGAGENPEHAGNGLLRGIDNWYHLSQEKVEFRFDGTGIVTRPTPNHGQWGLAQDDFGRLYYTPNSNPLLTDYYPKHYGARNPAQGGAPGIGEDICKDGTTWPAHPTPGVNRGYQENVLRPDGTLASVTAACGTIINRAGLLGEDLRGDAFICDASANLVKRLVLREKDGWPRGENVYKGTEFLRSTDERFRPVNLIQGPDGALYVLDMYRGLIQHKTYVTPYLARQVKERGLETPLVLGRVYRVGGGSTRQARHLSEAADADVVPLLRDPDGWWRDTAQRLLVERRADGAAPAVRALFRGERSPASRVSALWTLEGLGKLTTEDVAAALDDRDAGVRRNGLRLAEGFLAQTEIWGKVTALLNDENRQVRVQAAATLSGDRAEESLSAMVSVLRGSDRYMRGAVISGLSGRETDAIRLLLKSPSRPDSNVDDPALTDLVDVGLREGEAPRADLIDFLGALGAHPKAGLLLARVGRAQRLESDSPRVLKLAHEPTVWLAAIEKGGPHAAAMGESAVYFDWPGRPPVKRKVKLREMTQAEQSRFEEGRQLYAACVGCHQLDGAGSVGMAPPLAGSSIVLGPPERLANVLLYGMEGPYTMLEMEFEGVMVAAPLKSDGEFAAVMTYIRRSFANEADPVDADLVTRVRAQHNRTKPWKRAEIEGMK